MRVSYRTAVIRLCLDLTSENAKSVPVAVLLVGSAEDQRFAAARAIEIRTLPVDPLARAILGDVVGLIRSQLDEMVENDPRDPEQMLFHLQNALRNSLHVSSISERAEVDLSLEGASVDKWILDTVDGLLDEAVRESGMLVVHEGGRRSAPPDVKQKAAIRPTQLWSLGNDAAASN